MLKDRLSGEILAILFASSDPILPEELEQVFDEVDPEQLKQALADLVKDFNAVQEAVEIRRIAGGYRLTTLPTHHEKIRAYLRSKPSAKLSQAALETLAVIAYKQPVTLPEIMDIRGIKSTTTIKTLLEKRLIETRGRRKIVGRPIMYGTTREFLIHFGLEDLSELPTMEEFEEIMSDC